MRPLLIILGNLFILSNFYFSSARKEIVTLSFTPKSTLIIKGKSNVHEFECDYNTYELSDSLRVNFKKHDNMIVFENTQLLLEKKEFNCGGRGINKDFHKLLQTKDFPNIKMNLKKVALSGKNTVNAELSFTICEITKIYTVPISILNQHNKMIFKGSIALSLQDFNLTMPKKIMGLIKVKDTIVVDINLESIVNKKTP
jgi:polyisoprenoid-binding protein YceI